MTRKKQKYSILRTPPHALKDFLDFDYLHLLSEKDKEYLNNFAKAHYQGCGSDAMSKGDTFTLDSTGKQTTGKRAGYARYNSAFRDAMTRFSRQKNPDYLESLSEPESDDNNNLQEG